MDLICYWRIRYPRIINRLRFRLVHVGVVGFSFLLCFCIIVFDSCPIVYLEIGIHLLFVWLLRNLREKLETTKVINFVSIFMFFFRFSFVIELDVDLEA